jgi:hypothetical protein
VLEYMGNCVYAEAVVALVEEEVEAPPSAGDTEPLGSIIRLISTIGEVDRSSASPYVDKVCNCSSALWHSSYIIQFRIN